MDSTYRRIIAAAAAWLAVTISVDAARAQPLPVPPALQPYVDWVRTRNPDHLCPVVQGSAVCLWPGTLELTLDARGGRFTQRVEADRAFELPLPGSAERWPVDVRLGAATAVVLSRDGGPVTHVPAGAHIVTGRFEWPHLPEVLRVPAATAALSLSVAGEPVPSPRRDGERLWLASAARERGQGERIELQVHRRIEDGVPMRVITRISVRAAGRAREMVLGSVLLPGTVPIALSADLPARLDEGGKLSAQVRAGEFEIELLARYERSPDALAAPKHPAPWPEREVWVFAADELTRQVVLDGAPRIDPARTELPRAWRDLPAYVMSGDAKLTLTTRRRGQPEPPPNKLSLARELWLDLDGQGYVARDTFEGQMSRGFRLDLRQGALGHVVASGKDQLITRAVQGQGSGVELRDGALSMVAEWRGQGGLGDLAAVGWSEDVSGLSATLHLPPGYRLLAAEGVDEVRTWVGRWDLLDFFLVLLVALSVGRLLGPGQGLLALLTMVLCAHEQGAPQAVWLFVVAGAALLRFVRAGRGRTALSLGFGVVLLSLAAIALPFVTDQLRLSLYPQLAHAGGAGVGVLSPMLSMQDEVETLEEEAPEFLDETAGEGRRAGGAPLPAAPPAEPSPKAAQDAVMSRELAKERAAPMRKRAYRDGGSLASVLSGLASDAPGSAPEWLSGGYAQDPSAVVQTGPGVPSWRFEQVRLTWSGPVQRDHRISLYLLPPAVVRALGLLRVVLVVMLALVLLRASRRAYAAPPPAAGSGGDPGGESGGDPGDEPGAASRGESAGAGWVAKAASVAGVLLLAWLPGLQVGHAQSPAPELLQELQQRLEQPPECLPDCVDVARVRLNVDDAALSVDAEVHVGAPTSVRLPGPAKSWVPATVRVDGLPSHAMAVLDDGFVHLRLSPGRHAVALFGPLPPGDTLTLAFGDVPRGLSVDAPGFEVSGLREDGRPAGNLVLSRKLRAGQAPGPQEGSALPAFTLLTRTFVIGTTWQVRSVLSRQSPPGTPVTVRLPLLKGESVTDAAVEVKDGQVHASLGRDDTTLTWTSSLQAREQLSLRASKQPGLGERWVLRCGPVWHCATGGLPPVRHMQGGKWAPEFRPWPGEALKLDFQRPVAAEGASTTIDDALLTVTPGVRMLEATLRVKLRSSTGGVHHLTLPVAARVQSLQVDGRDRAIRQSGGKLGIQLSPGQSDIELSWQQPGGLGVAQQVPRVDLGARAANARIALQVPGSRVLIWAMGPAWGPAVLFWGYLLLVILLAVGLSRIPDSPLRLWQWILLFLGLSQVPLAALVAVVGWFFAMQRRGRWVGKDPQMHNAAQLGLVVWSLIAAGCLYGAVHEGLLMRPDMQVQGADSSDHLLRWIVDDVTGVLPQPTMVSLPLWMWKVGMLVWALWLSASLLRWLPWAWGCFSHGGRFQKLHFRKRVTAPKGAPAPAPAPPEPPDHEA